MEKPEEIQVTFVEIANAPGETRDGCAFSSTTSRERTQRTVSAKKRIDFNAGEVIGLVFFVFGKNPLLYLFLSVASCLPGMLLTLYSTGSRVGMVKFLADTFLSVIFMGAIAYGVYKGLIGERAGLGDALIRGLESYFSLVGISLLYLTFLILVIIVGALLSWIGMILALGVIVYCLCVFAVSTPACVVEKLGTMKSIDRSGQLTAGHRGSVFGLFFAYAFGTGIVVYVLKAVFPASINGANIARTAVQPFFHIFMQIMIAVLYYRLRSSKEGVSVDKLARVFD